MNRWIFTLFAVVVWALLLSRPGGFRRIFFEYVMRFTGSKKRLGEAEGKSLTHTHTSDMGAPPPTEEISGCHYQILIPMLSVSITAVKLWVLKVIDLSPNLQTNILPALFSWPAAMLSEGQSLVLMDFALVGTERVDVIEGLCFAFMNYGHFPWIGYKLESKKTLLSFCFSTHGKLDKVPNLQKMLIFCKLFCITFAIFNLLTKLWVMNKYSLKPCYFIIDCSQWLKFSLNNIWIWSCFFLQ